MIFNNVPGSAGLADPHQAAGRRFPFAGTYAEYAGKSDRSITGGCGFAAQQYPGLASPPVGIGSHGIDLASSPLAGKDR